MSFFYATFKVFMKLALRLYFKRIKIEGLENVPRNTPLIVTPNHQNAFLDALLVGAFIPVPLHYLTRSDVFKWWTKPLTHLLHMIPIYRIRDGYSKLSLNDTVFENCRDLFEKDGSILIFAEGNHGKDYFLRPLTKGAARLALQSQSVLEKDLMIQPVGLNFFNHQKSRSVVIMKFGNPVPVKDHLTTYQSNQANGLIIMRDAIADAMKSTLIIPNDTEGYDRQKKIIFQERHEHLTFEELKSMEVDEKLSNTSKNVKASKHLIAKLLNPLPFLVIHKVISRIDDVVFHSSLKFAIGLFLFPIWWAMIFLIFIWLVGINIASLAVLLMVLGLFYSYQS